MALKKVFISFDWDNDRDYRHLLSAFNANPANDIESEDSTPAAIDTKDVGRVKAVLTTKIRNSTHTLVLIGQYANTKHRDSEQIGTRNWQWWEIEKSKDDHDLVPLDRQQPVADRLVELARALHARLVT